MAAQHERTITRTPTPRAGPFAGIRVIELAGKPAQYYGLTLPELGANLVKVESRGADGATRPIGDFCEDKKGLERSR